MLSRLKERPAYRCQTICGDGDVLTKPLFKRLQGYRQITDAYRLGLPISEAAIVDRTDRRSRRRGREAVGAGTRGVLGKTGSGPGVGGTWRLVETERGSNCALAQSAEKRASNSMPAQRSKTLRSNVDNPNTETSVSIAVRFFRPLLAGTDVESGVGASHLNGISFPEARTIWRSRASRTSSMFAPRLVRFACCHRPGPLPRGSPH
jgi:hypothetical protein